jgi:hypothetical protein
MNTAKLKSTNLLKVTLVAAAAVLAACLLALVGTAKPAEAVFPAANGQIAFSTDRDGHLEIYAMDPDGSNPSRLTDTVDEVHYHPAWSPDGRKIALEKLGQIYTMNADGSNLTNLTNRPFLLNTNPTWSPDGRKLAWAGGTENSIHQDIFTMDADGSNQTNITNTPALFEYYPDWSPDGSKMCLYRGSGDEDTGIYIMNADGSNPTRLTDEFSGVDCEWSPDGTKIAYSYHPEFSGSAWPDDVYVMNADGSGKTNLTNSPAHDVYGGWSPDGTRMVFSSDRDGDFEIYTMNPDGSDVTQITTNSWTDGGPDWGRLVYDFTGFYQPVDNLPTLNKTKAGKAIPIRFSLGGDKGLDIFYPDTESPNPMSEAINCTTGAPTDDIEQTVTGKGGLSYNASTGRYEYDWATSSAWSGTCRQFVMTLKDGTVQRANFTFK